MREDNRVQEGQIGFNLNEDSIWDINKQNTATEEKKREISFIWDKISRDTRQGS